MEKFSKGFASYLAVENTEIFSHSWYRLYWYLCLLWWLWKRLLCYYLFTFSITKFGHQNLLLSRKSERKGQSLPRLELFAAVLLVNLLKLLLKHLEFPIHNVLVLMHSTVILPWISAEPYCWVPFDADCVAKVQNTISDVK